MAGFELPTHGRFSGAHRGIFLDLKDRFPGPGDIALLVEVSDSTLSFDLRTKSALYARAEFADYWVLDINQRKMIVHRDPREGRYQSVTVYSASESVSPLAAPERQFAVRSAFPE